eukprot:scaffold39838_cov70-Phaeocystis_antarctica.AAC.14
MSSSARYEHDCRATHTISITPRTARVSAGTKWTAFESPTRNRVRLRGPRAAGGGGDGGFSAHANWRPSSRPNVSQCSCSATTLQLDSTPEHKPRRRSA